MTTTERPLSKKTGNIPTSQVPEMNLASIHTFSGPIPPPQCLQQYELLVPGIAQRFLEEPLLESKHRRSLEQKLTDAKITLSRRGQWMALFLATLSILAAFWVIFLGYSLAGFGVFCASVGAFVGTFLYGKKQQR